jgi:hypothetical protein
MVGARLVDGAAADDVAAGIALHHACDRAFHALPGFRALERDAIAALEVRGVDRGPARGAAHVAVELLLDGALIGRDRAADARYLEAVALAPTHGAAHGDHPRMGDLIARLARQGLPIAYRDPREVARRTAWALAGRPRLALDAAGAVALAEALPALRGPVDALADALPALMR